MSISEFQRQMRLLGEQHREWAARAVPTIERKFAELATSLANIAEPGPGPPLDRLIRDAVETYKRMRRFQQ